MCLYYKKPLIWPILSKRKIKTIGVLFRNKIKFHMYLMSWLDSVATRLKLQIINFNVWKYLL